MKTMQILKFYLVIGLIVISCLLYVYQHTEIVKVSYVIKSNEAAVAQLLDQNGALRYNIQKLENPNHLEARLHSNNIVLTMPDKWHVVGVPRPKEEVEIVSSLENKKGFFDFIVPKALANEKPTR